MKLFKIHKITYIMNPDAIDVAMRRSHLTQGELAKKAGISASFFSELRKGTRFATHEMKEKVSRAIRGLG